jgi:formamidopyrimidine-DNA glycosylase
MWLSLDDGSGLAVHLRMSGQAQLVAPDTPYPDHTHLVLDFSDQVSMLYVDPRRFGRLEIIDPVDPVESVLLRNIGPDALFEGLTAEMLRDAAMGHGIGIKEFILDQTHISGIGNIYASEILHRVGLDPSTAANRVSADEMDAILKETRQVLGEAIEACGTTLADARYQSALGRSGEFAAMLRVYDREGEVCRAPGCEANIRKRVSGGRSTYLCPECQRTGRGRRPGR